MNQSLAILIVEDNEIDADLCVRALRRAGMELSFERVDTVDAFTTALKSRDWHVVLSDYTMPRFSAMEALRLLRSSSVEIPFVVVTGTIDEETAVECLKQGADDYILKSNLARLPSSIEHALAAFEARRARKQLEEQLRHAQRLETIGTLAGGVAHDFTNLLTAIANSAELLKPRIQGDARSEEAVKVIESAVEQATGVTRALLTFSHRMPTDRQQVDLRLMVTESAGLLRRVLRQTIELAIDVNGTPPLWMYADRVQLQQVLLNLAINARDAMPSGGVLSISLRPATLAEGDDSQSDAPRGKNAAHLIISDTGEGMSPQVRDRIFEPYFTTKSRDQGTGLGLAIAHGIIKGHHGAIKVDSVVGEGTVFTVTLPCLATPEDSPAPRKAAPAKVGTGQKILLAVNDRYIRELMSAALTSQGFHIRAVDVNADLACSSPTSREDIQLMIIDLSASTGGVPDWIRTLRAADDRTPVILITEARDHGLDSLGDNHTLVMEKPLQLSDLGEKVAELIATGDERPGPV